MSAADQATEGTEMGEGIFHRVRANPRLAIAVAVAVLLVAAWIGWAIYVTSSDGATAGLGVVIAWPAMLAALALVCLPFIGGYLLIRRLSDGEGSTTTADADVDEEEGEKEEGEEEEDTEEESGSETEASKAAD